MTNEKLNIVPFVSVDHMMKLVLTVGVETFLKELAEVIEEDFRRWEQFDKTPRVASHSDEGVIELMPTSDGTLYGFKYVNGHPKNTKEGRQTVTAFGVLADVGNGYPMLLTEMTILTALRTAAMSAVAAKHLARPDSKTITIIGNGAQSEFQALAFKAILGVENLRLFDIDRSASERCARNLSDNGLSITIHSTSQEAVEGADIITTVTADKQYATILSDNMVGPGVHINAVGGDCPGKTELNKEILLRSDILSNIRRRPASKAKSSSLMPITRSRNSGKSSLEQLLVVRQIVPSRCSTVSVSQSKTFLRYVMFAASCRKQVSMSSLICLLTRMSRAIFMACCSGAKRR